jgi:glycosyltransferase involved in cell wall biosynthesis
LRVLLDISVLGLGYVRSELRGGTFRVHEHLLKGLAGSGECDLSLCANYSSVAFAGCVEYLRASPALRDRPLLGPPVGRATRVGRIARSVHGSLRRLAPGGVLPTLVSRGAQRLDRRLHSQIRDASPGADVFHSLGARLPPRVPGARAPQRVVNIYDLAPIRLASLYGRRQRHLAEARLAGLGSGDWVITTSDASRADLVELAGVDPARIFVVPLAADPRLFSPLADPAAAEAVRARLGIGSAPYLLLVHASDPRKNIGTAVRACARAASEGRGRELTLVIAGPPPAEPHLRSALAEAVRAGVRVIVAGYVSDEELAVLFGGAVAFLYPSLYEGFGLPLLEAMQCGTPVIAGWTSSIPEVVGDAGLLVALEDPDALPAAILRVWSDDALCARLRVLARQRAATFSWERTVRETLAAYGTMVRAGR